MRRFRHDVRIRTRTTHCPATPCRLRPVSTITSVNLAGWRELVVLGERRCDSVVLHRSVGYAFGGVHRAIKNSMHIITAVPFRNAGYREGGYSHLTMITEIIAHKLSTVSSRDHSVDSEHLRRYLEHMFNSMGGFMPT